MICLQGYIYTTYDDLVEVLGDSDDGYDFDKITTQWTVYDDNGREIHVYDWKLPSRPYGPYSWHVGGADKQSVEYIKKLFDMKGVALLQSDHTSN